MKEFLLHQEIWLPAELGRVFQFFSDASNLESITPPWLNFKIVTPTPVEMQVGIKIDYKLRIHGLPLKWQSEITSWEPPHGFVDEQRRGPYQEWIHEHRFEENNGGTNCVDHVRYSVLGGALIEKIFVRRDVTRIFDFRRSRLLELFPE